MEKLRVWLRARRVSLDVKRRGEDCFWYEASSGCVEVNGSAPRAERLHAALHECGHVQVWLGRRRHPNRRVAGCSLKELAADAGRWKPRSTRRRLATMEEELEAWTRGIRLARRLRIRVNGEAFEASRARALMTYARWAARA